tara:strand:- start:1487 stop:1933 length:447 start_codon:yes stop_codon:yes gene_type:complete
MALTKVPQVLTSNTPHYTSAGSAPGSPSAGDLWYDTGNSKLKYYNGSSWAETGGGSGAYSTWEVKTTTYTASSGDQLICNHASTAFTVTLPASPSAGDTVTLKNVGAALITVGRNSEKIDSAAEDGTLPTGNSVQLVYVDSTIGWTSL